MPIPHSLHDGDRDSDIMQAMQDGNMFLMKRQNRFGLDLQKQYKINKTSFWDHLPL
jgi:hypothetical protein